MKKRSGFTLVEMVVVTIVLAIVTIACVIVSRAVNDQRVQSRNSIYLTTHNLNVMEQLRRYMNTEGEGKVLYSYYGFQDDDEERALIVAAGEDPATTPLRPDYSTEDVRTEVFIEIVPWDNFHLYNIRIESKLIGYNSRVTNNYIMTDIGIEKNPITVPDPAPAGP